MKGKNDRMITVVIKTTQGVWETEFSKRTKIQDVINSTITHFGFAQNGSYELRLECNPNRSLKPERTLVSYGFEDGVTLIFTDLGVAV